MKKIFFSLLALILTMNAMAERNQKYSVAVTDFTYNNKSESTSKTQKVLGTILDIAAGQVTIDKGQYVDAVRAKVLQGIGASYRLHAIDGPYQAGEVKTDGTTLYASGILTNISTTQRSVEDAKKKVHIEYKAQISVTVHLKDAATDKVVNSKTFTVSDYDCSWIETSEGAITNALAALGKRVHSYYNTLFPLHASIIEGSTEKKDKQKEVYIDLGSQSGVHKGMHLKVFVTKTVAGKEAKKEIGKLKVEEIQGDEVSLCKVQKGGAEIKAALDAGETVLVTSVD